MSVWLVASTLPIVMTVYPSGRALTAASVPMVVLPPGRLSTTTCCPHASVSCCPRRRAVKVVLPPGAYGVMKRIGLLGYSCCAAAAGPALSAPSASQPRSRAHFLQAVISPLPGPIAAVYRIVESTIRPYRKVASPPCFTSRRMISCYEPHLLVHITDSPSK